MQSEMIEKTPNVGCQNNRDRALGNVRIPKMKSECSMRGTHEWSKVLFVDRSQKRITVADEGNLSLPHSETSHLVFFVLMAHMPGGERQNTMRSDGGNPSMKVKMDIHFFGVQTPPDTGISAKGKKTP